MVSPNRDNFLKQIVSPKTMEQYRKDPDGPRVYSAPTDWFLNLASAMRWISYVVSAIQDGDMQLILKWVKAEYVPPVDNPSRPPDIPPDAYRIVLEPEPDNPQRADYDSAIFLLGSYHPQFFFPSKWKTFPEAQARRIAVSNISEHINILVSPIKMILTDAGTPRFSVRNHTDAMALFLYNQLSGAQGIKICRNPNCPTKFFLPKRKSNRKPRSDRKYCGRPGCQRYCYDHPEIGLGPLRTKG